MHVRYFSVWGQHLSRGDSNRVRRTYRQLRECGVGPLSARSFVTQMFHTGVRAEIRRLSQAVAKSEEAQ